MALDARIRIPLEERGVNLLKARAKALGVNKSNGYDTAYYDMTKLELIDIIRDINKNGGLDSEEMKQNLKVAYDDKTTKPQKKKTGWFS